LQYIYIAAMSKPEKVEEMKINDSKFTLKIDEAPEKKIRYRDDEKPAKKKKQENEKEKSEKEEEHPEIPELDYEENDIEAKRKRFMIISRYKNSKRFGNWLKTQGFEFNTKGLKDKTVDELENMINDIRFCISTKNTNNMYETGATKGILVLENMLRPVYKVDGLSQILSNDPMYLDLVEELLLERANYVYVKPEYRLLYCVLSSAYIVHAQHMALEKLSQTDEGKKMIKDLANQIQVAEQQSKPLNSMQNEKIPKITTKTICVEKKQLDSKFCEKYKDLF